MDWRFDGLTALVSIAAGKAADLVVLAGNRAKNIDDVERVETVFKDGVGYYPTASERARPELVQSLARKLPLATCGREL